MTQSCYFFSRISFKW